MSGTDRTKTPTDMPGPVVILVEPQLGENIGMAARAMGNFGLTRLRIVNPRDGWPNVHATRAAAGADHIIDRVELFDTVGAAVADLNLLFATSARPHDQAKPVVGPDAAAREIVEHVATGGGVGILFGRERYGLQAEEVALADRIVTFPVNPGFASLNLAQAVLLVGYEWFKLVTKGALPHEMPQRSPRAGKEQMSAFFDNLVRELDKVEFLRPPEKRDTMLVNLRNIFTRMEPTKQDMHTLHGVVMAIADGRKGPAKGGVLDGAQATRLRALLAEQAGGGGRKTAARCAVWRGCCDEIPPTRSAFYGMRCGPIGALPAISNVRRRWAGIFRISFRSAGGLRSNWSIRTKRMRSRRIARRENHGSNSAGIACWWSRPPRSRPISRRCSIARWLARKPIKPGRQRKQLF